MEIPVEMMHIPLRRFASSGEGNVSIDLDRLGSPLPSPKKSMRSDSTDFHTLSCTAWLVSTLTRTLKSLVPRRLDEPTGPFELVTFHVQNFHLLQQLQDLVNHLTLVLFLRLVLTEKALRYPIGTFRIKGSIKEKN